ncbi:hypothetical protein AgCh_036508 [Apium graveolens]
MGLAYCLTASWWTPNLADWRSQELGSMGQLNHDDQITVGERYSDEYVIVYTNGRTVQGHRVILSTSKVDILIRAKVQGAFSTYRMLYPTAGTITKSSSADKVAACAKHYVGDGGTTKGINGNNTIISRHKLLSIHMPAYYNAIIKGVATVMVSYSSWNGVKMHANRYLITEFLKNTLQFRGFVISDYAGIDQITTPSHANYTYSIVAGINAGIDMVMVAMKYKEFIHGLSVLVKKKYIPMTRINDAVKRILRVKFMMGLFENLLADLSMAKYLVVVVGEFPYAETMGDSLNLTIPKPGPNVIKNVCRWIKCVVILMTGRPVMIQPYIATIDALVAAWLPGTEGQRIADVLFGDYGFTGKLPHTWFKTVDQLPMNVGDPHYDPLFPFGFGLST